MNLFTNYLWHENILCFKVTIHGSEQLCFNKKGKYMIADKILGNTKETDVKKKQVPVKFEWFELEKKRSAKIAEDGTHLGVSIEQVLKDKDIIAETKDTVYVATVLPARLIKIHVDTMQEMGRLGFELGNRHLSLQILEHEVRVPYDEPTYLYLEKLGFEVEQVEEQFSDYIVCKAHGHSHGDHHSH